MNNLPEVRSVWRRVILTVGYTFLYAPMLMLVIYSFNSSKLVTVWAGWSTRWYTQLFNDSEMISAVGLSLTIAAASATMAVVLGTIAAVVMVRFGRFRGSTGFAFMLTAPLVMPDVITGLSLLLLFVAMGHAIAARRTWHVHHLAGPCDFLHGLCDGGHQFAVARIGPFYRRGGHGSGRDTTEGLLCYYCADDRPCADFWLVAGLYLIP